MVTAAVITEAGAAVTTVAEDIVAAVGTTAEAIADIQVAATVDIGVAIVAATDMADGTATDTAGEDTDLTTRTTGRTIDPSITLLIIRPTCTEHLTTRTRITIPLIIIPRLDLASPIGVIDSDLRK